VLDVDADVVNLGLGVANTGLNNAIGNESTNTANVTQDPLLVGFVFSPGGGAFNSGATSNTSNGTAKVGTGNANAAGNVSDTAVAQAVTSDAALVLGGMASNVVNLGVAVGNSGINTAIGNQSVNNANVNQLAQGFGLVTNTGSAKNVSDGTSLVGDVICPVPGVPGGPGGPGNLPKASAPGADAGGATLPRTGGPLEAQALFGLLLLLTGAGLRRMARSEALQSV